MPSSSFAAKRVTVVGGANTDVVGRSLAPLVARDSNPGHARRSPGGVARNVAENLARLGARVTLLTAFGGDPESRELEAGCRAHNIVTTPSLVCRDLPGSIYLAILDETGDMALALNDMRPLDRLTPERLASRRAAFDGADFVVADANLSTDALEWLAAEVSAPLLLDLVSAAKAPRAREVIGRTAAIKCNAIEAGALLGMRDVEEPADVERATRRLLEQGAGSAFVSAGTAGTYFASREDSGWVAAPTVEIADATGAGDAMTAGVAAALLAERSIREAAGFGSRLAALTLASPLTVSDAVDTTVFREALKEWRGDA